MSRTISKKIYGVEKQIFWALGFAIIMSLASYGYFVGKSIINVVVREEVELSIAEINSHLSDLEFQYLAKKDTITLSFAQSNGFGLVSKRTFVNRGTLVGSLSLNNEI
jgi:hypothetical protein